VVFSADGRTILTPNGTNAGGAVKLWDVPTEKERITLSLGQAQLVQYDGQHVVSVSRETFSGSSVYKIRIWETASGMERRQITIPHLESLDIAAVSTDERRVILYGGSDHYSVVQDVLDLHELLVLAWKRVTRDFTAEERALFLGEAVPTPMARLFPGRSSPGTTVTPTATARPSPPTTPSPSPRLTPTGAP
jgi:WD40 repeat protein